MSCSHPACPYPVVLGIVYLRRDVCRQHLQAELRPEFFVSGSMNPVAVPDSFAKRAASRRRLGQGQRLNRPFRMTVGAAASLPRAIVLERARTGRINEKEELAPELL